MVFGQCFIILSYFGVFAFNENIAKSKKVYLAITTGFLSYTAYYYGAAKPVFLLSVFLCFLAGLFII
ncbi:hypothetical protein D3C81_1721740 [compost metagenome]